MKSLVFVTLLVICISVYACPPNQCAGIRCLVPVCKPGYALKTLGCHCCPKCLPILPHNCPPEECPSIECAPGYEPKTLRGDCCPTCVPADRCQPEECYLVDCRPLECAPGYEPRTIGCDCCPTCVPVLGEGERCKPGKPGRLTCATGLVCIDHICVVQQ